MSNSCTSCGRTDGRNFCVRCKRTVCDRCWNTGWSLCRECSAYKEGVRWDLHQILSNTSRTALFASEKMSTNCSACPVLRDQLLYLLKTVKNVEYSAQQEGLFDEQHQAAETRKQLTNLAVKVLAGQGLKANADLWRHL